MPPNDSFFLRESFHFYEMLIKSWFIFRRNYFSIRFTSLLTSYRKHPPNIFSSNPLIYHWHTRTSDRLFYYSDLLRSQLNISGLTNFLFDVIRRRTVSFLSALQRRHNTLSRLFAKYIPHI